MTINAQPITNANNTADWTKMGHNKNVSFYQIQNDFNQYWLNKTPGKGEGYKPFKRWEKDMENRVYPSGDINLTSTNFINFLQWETANSSVPITNLISGGTPKSSANWTSLSGNTVPTGYDAGAGRVNFITFDPSNVNTIFVGTPDGGLWKTTNGGASWSTNTDLLPIIGCAGLVIHPTNNQIMYLATGDKESDRRSMGILKTTDGGTTWNPTSLVWTPSDNYTISDIIMDPTNSNVMMVSTDGGIFRTTDAWVTHTQVGFVEPMTDLEFKPGNSNVVYATSNYFYKSTDNGATWTDTHQIDSTSSVINGVKIAVSAANPNYVYYIRGNTSYGYGGLFRSTDSGDNFSAQSTSPNILNSNPNPGPTDVSGQSFHDLAIVVSPSNANLVTIGGVNQWQSTDGGVNWNRITFWTGFDPDYPGQNTQPEPYIHADIQYIKYEPGSSTTFYSACDGGISKTIDGGTSWADITNNLAINQQTNIAVSATTENFYFAGLQDVGSLKHTASGWSVLSGGDGEDGFIDRTNDMNVISSTVQGAFYVSYDGGVTTDYVYGLPSGGEWLSPIKQDPAVDSLVYIGGFPSLYKNTNLLTGSAGLNFTFTLVGTPLGSGNIRRFEIAPSNHNTIYALKGNVVSKSTDAGVTWSNVTGTLPVTSAKVYNLAISATDPNKVWVVFSGYSAANKVFQSTDGGSTWTNISAGLPNLPINTIVYDKNSTNDAFYIGADIGVFYRDNDLAAWDAYFDGLARCSVRDLEIFYPTGKLRAATYGRGAWEADLYVPAAANHIIVATTGANGSISPSGSSSVSDGSNETFYITADACYEIDDVLVDGVSQGAMSSYTFSNITTDHTIEAAFTQAAGHTITATAGANGTISSAGATNVDCGASQSYIITPDICYEIASITVNGANQPVSNSYTFTNVNADQTIDVTFVSVATSTINASAGANGSISPSGVTSVACGASQSYTITPDVCYEIEDVLVDGVSVGPLATYTFSGVSSMHTIEAVFSSKTFNITAVSAPNGTISSAGNTDVDCGENMTYTFTPDPCYKVKDVIVDGAFEPVLNSYTFTNVTSDHTIHVDFELVDSTTITASAGLNGTISPEGISNIACGNSQTYNITPYECYEIEDVIVDGVSQGNINTYTFQTDEAAHTISVSFIEITGHTIVATTGANGAITPAGAQSVACNGMLTFDFSAEACYEIEDVLIDGVSQGSIETYTFTDVTADHTVEVSFASTHPETPVASVFGTTLSSSEVEGNQWYNESGAIAGETNQMFTATSNGEYYTIVTIDGCSSEISNAINLTVSSIDNIDFSVLKIYPNPVEDILSIELEGNTTPINFQIVNVTGQIVYSGVVTNKVSIATTNFSVGTYIIQLEDKETFEFEKIIKN